MTSPSEDGPTCFLCGGQPTEYCFGCRRNICDEHVDNPWGPHEPEDHDYIEDAE